MVKSKDMTRSLDLKIDGLLVGMGFKMSLRCTKLKLYSIRLRGLDEKGQKKLV